MLHGLTKDYMYIYIYIIYNIYIIYIYIYTYIMKWGQVDKQGEVDRN